MVGEIAGPILFGPVGVMLIGATLSGCLAAHFWPYRFHDPKLETIPDLSPDQPSEELESHPPLPMVRAQAPRRSVRGRVDHAALVPEVGNSESFPEEELRRFSANGLGKLA